MTEYFELNISYLFNNGSTVNADCEWPWHCKLYLTGYYFSGDGARRTADGYYQITGRMDDVLNVSGHRLGTAEIEDILVCSFTIYD